MKIKLVTLTFILGLAGIKTALAHHSFAAEFDGNKPVRIEGSLSKIEWTNPHSYFYVDVKDDRGNVVTWGCEGANPGPFPGGGSRRVTSNLEIKSSWTATHRKMALILWIPAESI